MKFKRINKNGRYRIVVIKDGKYIESTKWSPKFQLNQAKERFKKNNTFKKDISISRDFKNVIEITDTSPKPRIRKGADRYQYFFEARYRGERFVARSKLHDRSFPKQSARNEALRNIKGRLGNYDEDDGETIFQQLKNIREGIVVYV